MVPQKWVDSDPQYIMNSQEVKLRSFTTSVSVIGLCLCLFAMLLRCETLIVLPVYFLVSSSGFDGDLQRGR